MRLGLLAILIGVIYLLKNLNFITELQWGILWPIILIYLGITLVVRHRCWHCRVWHDGSMMDVKRGNVCDCDCEGCRDCKHAH